MSHTKQKLPISQLLLHSDHPSICVFAGGLRYEFSAAEAISLLALGVLDCRVRGGRVRSIDLSRPIGSAHLAMIQSNRHRRHYLESESPVLQPSLEWLLSRRTGKREML